MQKEFKKVWPLGTTLSTFEAALAESSCAFRYAVPGQTLVELVVEDWRYTFNTRKLAAIKPTNEWLSGWELKPGTSADEFILALTLSGKRVTLEVESPEGKTYRADGVDYHFGKDGYQRYISTLEVEPCKPRQFKYVKEFSWRSPETALRRDYNKYSEYLTEEFASIEFDSSGVFLPPEDCHNHYKAWEAESLEILKRTFFSGASLKKCCVIMGRSKKSIESRLLALGLIAYNLNGSLRYTETALSAMRASLPQASQSTTKEAIVANINAPLLESFQSTTKEVIMKTIETRTFINGQDASMMSDDAIFNAIRQQEAAIKECADIQAVPKKLAAKITKMQADLAAMVKYVDER